MTENEYDLIRIIREHDKPDAALLAAAAIILDFLKLHGSSVEPASADLQEPV